MVALTGKHYRQHVLSLLHRGPTKFDTHCGIKTLVIYRHRVYPHSISTTAADVTILFSQDLELALGYLKVWFAKRRQSGLKSGGSWIRVKTISIFPGKCSKNFDFFRQIFKKFRFSRQKLLIYSWLCFVAPSILTRAGLIGMSATHSLHNASTEET